MIPLGETVLLLLGVCTLSGLLLWVFEVVAVSVAIARFMHRVSQAGHSAGHVTRYEALRKANKEPADRPPYVTDGLSAESWTALVRVLRRIRRRSGPLAVLMIFGPFFVLLLVALALEVGELR